MNEKEQQRMRDERRRVEQRASLRSHQVPEQVGAARDAAGHLRGRRRMGDGDDGGRNLGADDVHDAAIHLAEYARFDRLGVATERLYRFDEAVVLEQPVREVYRRELLAARGRLVIRDVQHDLHLRR